MIFSENLLQILLCYAVFLTAYFANVFLKLFFNTEILQESFDFLRLYTGIKKLISIILGSLLLVFAIDNVMTVFGNITDIPQEIDLMVSVAMIISTIGVATYKYIKEAYLTLLKILDINVDNNTATK